MGAMLWALSASHSQRACARGKFWGGSQPRASQISGQGRAGQGRAQGRAQGWTYRSQALRSQETGTWPFKPQKQCFAYLCFFFFPSLETRSHCVLQPADLCMYTHVCICMGMWMPYGLSSLLPPFVLVTKLRSSGWSLNPFIC